jgi:ABC-type nitrate/sulfonate/bicarbonate transport system substrate-binding protein
VSQPLDFLALDRGYKKLLDLAESSNLPFAVIFATKAFVENNPDALNRFIQAGTKGTADFYSRRYEAKAIEIAARDTKSLPPLVERTYNYYQKIRAYSSNLGIPDEYVQNVGRFLARIGEVKAPLVVGKYVDRRYCRA